MQIMQNIFASIPILGAKIFILVYSRIFLGILPLVPAHEQLEPRQIINETPRDDKNLIEPHCRWRKTSWVAKH